MQESAILENRLLPRPSYLWLISLAGAATVLFFVTNQEHTWSSWAEDLPVYQRAVGDWLAGRSPYDAALAPLYFLYPPAFLLIAGWISHLIPGNLGSAVYLVVVSAALCAIPLILARYYFCQLWLSPLAALLLFFASPRFTGIRALRTMNIASIFYCLAFLAAVPGLRRNRWGWFYAAVFLAAIIKITFLALLLLPLLAGRRQWLRSIGCVAVVALANLGERMLWPDLYRGYTWSLNQGILSNRAFGYGIFGVLANHDTRGKGIGIAPYIVAGIVALALTALMFLMRYRLLQADRVDSDLGNRPLWLAMILITIVLVNPRELQYDVDVSVFAAMIVCSICLRIENLRNLLILVVLLFLPSQFVPHFVANPRLHGIYETFLSFAAFALGYWRLKRETAAVSGSPQPSLP